MKLAVELRAVPRPSLADVLEQLYTEKHTGPVVFHYAQGRPNAVEIPAQPTRIQLEKR